jgi:phage gpG-like protein
MVDDTRFVKGAAKLGRRIASIRAALNLPLLTEEIGSLLLNRVRSRFKSMVDPDGNPWKELAPATLRRKAQLGYGNEQKLVRKGSMRDAIQIIRGGLGSTFFNTGAGLRIGIQDPEIAEYARVQNKGQPGRIPARRFLGIGRLDVKAVDSLLRRKAQQLENV